jgi:DNA-binding beta-propeller fold protein YncE
MKGVCALCVPMLCLLASAALPAQQTGESTELPSRPFQIENTWIVGGVGNWDYLTVDPRAERLYIAHGHAVQVVDIKSGSLVGEVSGLAEAHSIVLDDTGEFGYVSDGRGGKVVVFDRRSLQTVATIAEVPSPRALVFEPQTRLLFAVRANPVAVAHHTATPTASRPAAAPAPAAKPGSYITIIDTQAQKVVGQILLPEALGFAQADDRGNVFINAPDINRILQFNAHTVVDLLPKQPGISPPASEALFAPPATPVSESATKEPASPFTIDWSERERQVRSFSVGPACTSPKSLAIDNAHQRLFAACGNLKAVVLNADTGNLVASLPIGPGVEAIGYDPGRGLIYAANGGADGSLTIIRHDVTDTYRVIQNLPTRQRARTLAVNPDTGLVYLVTDLLGMDLAQPGGIGTLRTDPVNGSFQVLVVGN